jgi:hypothetical protein
LAGEATEREHQVAQLLRQLSIGLSAYRLFPGNLEQPGFVAASRRIVGSADRVLSEGPFDAQITGNTFLVPEGPVAPDEAIERLAKACYERRVERIRVRTAPSTFDLNSLYEILNRPPDDVQEDGGADALLRKAGVVSIAVGELNPQAARPMATPAAEQAADPDAGDTFRLGLQLPDEDEARLRTSPADLAQSLFDRFQALVGALPPEMASNLELYRTLRTSTADLPEEQRLMLNAVLLDRVLDDPLAERYIGTMSDTELARILVEVATRFGRDPTEMASRLIAQRLRSEDLQELTAAIAEGRIEGGTVLAGGFPAAPDGPDGAGGQEDERHIYETVGDLLGQSLIAREQEDMTHLRADYPSTDEEARVTAADAVRDYLLMEDDLPRLERVLASWMGSVRSALRAVDPAGVLAAVAVVERPRAEAAAVPERAMLFDVYRNQAAEPELLHELVRHAKEPGGMEEVVELLSILEDAPVRALLDMLVVEPEGHDRTVLVALVTELARDHLDVIEERMGDQRAIVARDAVMVAYRALGTGAVPMLEVAGRHPSTEVRQEAIRGLVSVGGAGAVGILGDLARDADEGVRSLAIGALGGLTSTAAVDALAEVAGSDGDPRTRREALEFLAHHPSPLARERLRSLASTRRRPKLPRPLRRYAKALVKR